MPALPAVPSVPAPEAKAAKPAGAAVGRADEALFSRLVREDKAREDRGRSEEAPGQVVRAEHAPPAKPRPASAKERPLVKPDDTPAKKAKNRRYEIQLRF